MTQHFDAQPRQGFFNRRSLSTLGFLGLVLAASGCAPEFDDDLSVVTAPRLVAVQAVPAEAEEEDEVSLSALVVSPAPIDANKVDWAFCLLRKPLTELGAVDPRCLELGADEETAHALGNGAAVTSNVPENACRLFGPLRPDAKPGEPAGRPVDPDPTGGFYQPTVMWLSESDVAVAGIRLDCGLAGVGREELVEYRDSYRRNENPEVATLELTRADGSVEAIDAETPAQVNAGEAVSFSATWATCPRESECGDGVCGAGEDTLSCAEDCAEPKGCKGAESYVWLDPEQQEIEERRESIALSWYTTAGSFEEERTGIAESDPDEATSSNVWIAPQKPGVIQQWLVIQDDRGGASWRNLRIEVLASP